MSSIDALTSFKMIGEDTQLLRIANIFNIK